MAFINGSILNYLEFNMVHVKIPSTRWFRKTEIEIVKADELHVSSHGVLVCKRYGNVVKTFSHNTWLTAEVK